MCLYSLADWYQCCRGARCFHLHSRWVSKMETASYSKLMVHCCQNMLHHIPEDRNLGSTCWLSVTCHHATCFGDRSNIFKPKTANINNANYKVQAVAYYWMSEKHVSQQQVIKKKQTLWRLYISNLNISCTWQHAAIWSEVHLFHKPGYVILRESNLTEKESYVSMLEFPASVQVPEICWK